MRFHIYILTLAAFATAGASDPPTLVTGGVTNTAGASDSFIEAITPDGRWAVMVSHANNLTTNDDLHPYSDIVVRDLQAGRTLLVTVGTNGTGGGNGNSHYGSISSDGRYVIYASEASNLISNDTNGVSDVFRRDLQTGTTELVSIARTGGVASPSVNRTRTGASRPVVTPDGRWVAFESASTEFVEGDTNATGKIFVCDLQTGVTRLVSAGAQRSRLGSITDNGRFIAFIAPSAQSMPGRMNPGGDVFVVDLQTGQEFWASEDLPSPLVPEYKCLFPVVTPDGRRVFFKTTLSTTYVLQHDLQTRETLVLTRDSHPSTPLALSADGKWLAYEEWATIRLRDLEEGTDTSIAAGWGPVIAANAQHVAFIGAGEQIQVHDLVTGLSPVITMSEGARPLITADGAFVFFDTDVANIVANDHNGAHDVFRHHVPSRGIQLISVADPVRPSRTAMRSVTFNRHMVDATAARIAFVSPDIPGFAGDTNTFPDTFVREVGTGTLYAFPTQYDYWATNFSGSMKALDPRISANGVVLAFVRQQGMPATSDLVWQVIGGDPPLVVSNIFTDRRWAMSSNGQVLVYYQSSSYWWHDLGTGLRLRVHNNFGSSVISPDNQLLAYQGLLSPEVIHPVSNVVLRLTNTFPAKVNSQFTFSSGNRFLFYEGTTDLFRHDLQTRRTDQVCTNCMNLSITPDGEMVAYNAAFGGAPGDIIVKDLRTGIERVITTEFTPANVLSRRFSAPALSGDGRYIAFSTRLTNALAGDFNARSDIYVYDRVERSTLLISRSRFGEGPAAGSSTEPVMARDGRTLVFQSFANDLVDADYNFERDIFILRLGVGDSDNDGMDDDWEVAHFGDLNRDGAGDQDGDGQSDLQEFFAGTNPTNSGSILRVLTISRMGGGSTTVVWSAVVGRDYVVQYKDSLEGSWVNGSGVITADSTSLSFTQNSALPQRYYRVIAVQ